MTKSKTKKWCKTNIPNIKWSDAVWKEYIHMLNINQRSEGDTKYTNIPEKDLWENWSYFVVGGFLSFMNRKDAYSNTEYQKVKPYLLYGKQYISPKNRYKSTTFFNKLFDI